MARSSTTDPLEKFRFLVEWSTDTGSESSGIGRAGFTEVGMPKRNTNKINYREGHDPDINMLSAGLSSMEDITLTRGLIKMNAGDEANNAFYRWMSAVHRPQAGHPGMRGADATRPGNVAAAEYRKDVTIKVLDRTGAVSRVYRLYNAWPTNFVPGSDMNAGEDGDKMLESMTLAYEDFKELKPADSAEMTPSPEYTA